MNKAVSILMRFVEFLVTLLFAVSVLLVIAQVFWRRVLLDPIGWTEQISRALFCWMTMLGIPVLFNRNILMSFDMVQDLFKDRAHIWLRIAFRVIGIFFCVCWFIFSLELCEVSVGLVFSGVAIPKNALYGAQCACCVLMFIVQLDQIVSLLKELRRGSKEKEAYRMILWICIGIFAALLILGAPILLCLGLPPVIWLLQDGSIPNLVMGQKMYTAVDSFSLIAIPFFMLAGQVMERTGITEAIVDFANSVIGWVRGGLACTVELAGILMAGISGSSNADASALGAICLRALKKGGYEDGWASAIVVSAAGIGPIIPPSIIMIVYANATGLDIGKLFAAGILPGVLLGICYMVTGVIYAKKRNIPKIPFQGLKHVGKTFIKAIWALLMPLIIIGGILGGFFTATECGVIATVYGIAYGLIARRLKPREIWDSLRDGIIAAVGPISLIAISSIFSYMLAREGVTGAIADFVTNNIHSQFGVLAFVSIICIIAGCFVDGTATMLLLTPIFLPVVQAMNIDVLQFSMIFMIVIMSGGMTPPVGSMLFIISGIDGTPISRMVKPIIPFMLALIVVVILLMLIPDIASFIPGMLYGA